MVTQRSLHDEVSRFQWGAELLDPPQILSNRGGEGRGLFGNKHADPLQCAQGGDSAVIGMRYSTHEQGSKGDLKSVHALFIR